jgi:D-amino-acid oxidase
VVADQREAALSDLPLGAVAGVKATVPVISMSHYLPWLSRKCEDQGVRFLRDTVARVDDFAGAADLVVVAAGLRSGDLLGDDAMYPVRGQILRLANPGITEWVTDVDNPDGLTYVVPRRDDIVCGGVAEVGSWDTSLDAGTERAILRRATALVPALAGLPVLSRDVGLRPARDTIRLEHVEELWARGRRRHPVVGLCRGGRRPGGSELTSCAVDEVSGRTAAADGAVGRKP